MALGICSKGIKLFIPLLVVFAFSPIARAIPLTYFVNFSGVGTLPAVGVFNYDTAAQSFSNFSVSWDGNLYDLTSAANAPGVAAGGCPGPSSSPATGFALMNQSPCAGMDYRWFADKNLAASLIDFFSENSGPSYLPGASIQVYGPGGFTPFPVDGGGDWTLSAPISGITGTPVFLPGGFVYFPGVGVFSPGGELEWTLSAPIPGIAGTPIFLPAGFVYFPGVGLFSPAAGPPFGVNYLINFSGVGTLPAVGVFDYDASAQSFSNFVVSWDGNLYDLTSAANAPGVAAGGCPGPSSSPATGFALMNQSPCAGMDYRWFADKNLAASLIDFFSENSGPSYLPGASIQVYGPGGFTPFPVDGGGDWTITALPTGPGNTVPEPSTICMLLLGALLLVGRRTSLKLRV